MSKFFRHVFMRAVFRAYGKTIFVLILALIILGFIVVMLTEPEGSSLRGPGTYLYWFAATISTTGYGDVVPTTGSVRLYAGLVMVIALLVPSFLTAVFVKSLDRLWERYMKGKMSLNLENHTVILGNRDQETVDLVKFLKQDREASKEQIVLCSFRTQENPFTEGVEFVHGELHSDDVMIRACVAKANRIIIHADTDEKSVLIAIKVRQYNSTATKVVNLDDSSNEEFINVLGNGNEFACIKPMNVPLMAREITNPGITKALEGLLGNSGQEFYSTRVPMSFSGRTLAEVSSYFKLKYGALVYGLASSGAQDTSLIVNPADSTEIIAGMTVHYMALDKVGEEMIEWEMI